MFSHRLRSVITVAFAVFSLAVPLLDTASGVSVHGAVVNGTTGVADVTAVVSVIDPSSGMEAIQTVQATNGQFSVGKLEPGVYMARVDYAGVTYNSTFQIHGDEHASVTVTVYEATSSWEGIHVVAPHFTAARHSDHLVIERVYDIHNGTQPPKTLAGENASFRFPIPSGLHEFNGLYVQYGEVPIERDPVETEVEGVYKVDYPIRPGVTRVIMSYTAAYDTGAASMNEKIQYDISSFTIFATDTEMEIASSSHQLAEGEGPHSGVSWEIAGLKAGDVLNLSFTGGSSQESSGGGQRMVIVVPNDTEKLSLVLMFILLLALVAFTGIAVKEPRIDGAEALRLEDHREKLIRRLAKLDDVYETGAIPGAAYRAKRTELKNQVASLMFRLGTGAPAKGKSKGRKRSHAT